MADGSKEISGGVIVFGSLNVDLVCRVEMIARPGETVLGPTYVQLFGGKGANQAVAAARAGGRDVEVAMVGAVGSDDLGGAVIANLAENGVDASGVLRLTEPTGAAFIAIDASGENAITVASGANRLLTGDALSQDRLDRTTILALQMEVPVEANLQAAKAVKAVGGRVILNLAPVPPKLSRETFEALCAGVDILVVNEFELTAASQAFTLSGDDALVLAPALAAAAGLSVVATLGAAGAIAAEPDGTIVRIAALPVEPVDTTGAGDTFCGVLAASIAAGLDLRHAVRRAGVAASLACLGLGAQSAMPTAQDIDARLVEAEPATR